MTIASVGKFATNSERGSVALAGMKEGATVRGGCIADLKKGSKSRAKIRAVVIRSPGQPSMPSFASGGLT